ncbi:MAG: glycosyltransferase, partial [Actinomycetota bacterium]
MPRFSIVTPVYNPPLDALRDCIESVRRQKFQDWEWCIADDCSPNPKVRKELEKAAASDRRIR